MDGAVLKVTVVFRKIREILMGELRRWATLQLPVDDEGRGPRLWSSGR
jgi:hypothetical protein